MINITPSNAGLDLGNHRLPERSAHVELTLLKDYPQHIETLASWLHLDWGDLKDWSSFEHVVERFHERLNRDRAPISIIALDNGVPIGTASIKLHELDELYPNFKHWLGDVFVVPKFRGQGVGTAMTVEIIKVASELGIPKLYLYTPDHQSLYSRLGWNVIGKRSYDGESIVVMERSTELA